jgi:uncharacterized protein
MQVAVPIRLFRAAQRLTRRRSPPLPGLPADPIAGPRPQHPPGPHPDPPFDPSDFSPPLQTRLLVLQPTPFCNLDCDYCYLPSRDVRARMPVATVRLALQRLVDDGLLGPELTIAWHAGEPLVQPPDYYEEAFAAVAAVVPACRVTHAFQTNGTLIDDHWCELLSRHRVRVGISIDGPADLHDRHRRTRTGGGTHARAMRGLRRLQAHGIQAHVIAVLGSASLARADELHAFFTAADVRAVGYSFDEAEGVHAVSSLASHETEHEVFLVRTLALALRSDGRYRVRELEAALAVIAADLPRYEHAGRSWPQNAQVVPFSIVTVGWNGDFSCFSPEFLGQRNARYDDFVLGNVARGGYLEATTGGTFRRLWSDLRRGIAACEASCAYFRCCGGGAPVNKLHENGSLDSTETLYCRTMIQRPLETVLKSLEPRAAAWPRP